MTDKEQIAGLVDTYTDLLRIQKAEDKEKEIANQLRKAKVKLEVFGIVVDELTID